MEKLPFWRNIYRGINGCCKSVSPTYVADILNSFSSELLNGLLIYKPYTPESLEEFKKNNTNKILEQLVKKIGQSLNLDCTISYKLFCNYLMFEYFGKVNDIEEITRSEIYTANFLDKLWHFYTLERSYYLKIIQAIIMHCNDPQHIHQKALSNFVSKHTMTKIIDKLMDEYKYLINELHSNLIRNCPSPTNWVNRNNSEQIQILVAMIHGIDKSWITVEMCISILEIFIGHGFGTNPVEYYEAVSMSHCQDLKTIMLLENGIFVVAARHIWNTDLWTKELPEFDKIFINQISAVAKQPILLLCMTMLILGQPRGAVDSKYHEHITKLLDKSFHNEGFQILVDLLNIPLLQESSTEMILKNSIYEFVNQICMRVDNIFVVHSKPPVIDILVLLMKERELCEQIMREENTINALLAVTINTFPQDFNSLSKLSADMIIHQDFQEKMVKYLLNMEIYTEECPFTRLESYITPDDQTTNYGVIIPKHTNGRIAHLPNNRVILQFKGNFTYSYFQVLNFCLEKAFEQHPEIMPRKKTKNPNDDYCCNGINLIITLLENVPEFVMNDIEFRKAVNNGIRLFSKVIAEPNARSDLVKSCIKLCFTLMPQPDISMLEMLMAGKIIPIIPTVFHNINGLLRGDSLVNSRLVDLITEQRNQKLYCLLHVYLDFWIENSKLQHNKNMEKIQLPAVVYFIQDIFPTHVNWDYSDKLEKFSISSKILTYMFDVLKSYENTKNRTKKLIYDFCLECLLNNMPLIQSFIDLFRLGNAELDRILCHEVHWDIKRSRDLIATLKNCLGIALWVFNLKRDNLKQTHFWRFFFSTSKHSSSLVKIIADYINHQYDPELPQLALKLLRKICWDPSISVQSCLEMDSYQVECMFLERLRDPLEQMEVKVGILELISVCLKMQNGMTAGFFNLMSRKKWNEEKKEKTEDNVISSYFYEYLENISIAQEHHRGPIQSIMLELLHTIWVEKRTILIRNLIAKSNFWEILLRPLSEPLDLEDSIYAQLFNILAMELVRGDVNESLGKLIITVLSNNNFCTLFPKHIQDSFEQTGSAESAFMMLRSWQKFLVFAIKHNNNFPAHVQMAIVKSTIQGLKSVIHDIYGVQIALTWANLYLYEISHWGSVAYDVDTFEILADVYEVIEEAYIRTGKKGRETFVSIAIKTVEHLGDFFDSDDPNTDRFLYGMGKIIHYEYNCLFTGYMAQPSVHYVDHVCFMLLVTFGTKMLKHPKKHLWFIQIQLLHKVFSTFGHFTKHTEILVMVKILSNFLIAYMVLFSNEFIDVEFIDFFETIKFPVEYFNVSLIEDGSKEPSFYEEFWLTYASIMNFLLCATQKLQQVLINPMMMFFRTHKEEIFKILRLPIVTANVYALRLVSNTLKLCNFILRGKFAKDKIQDPMFYGYVKIITECFNSCISILLRPQVIRVFKVSESSSFVGVEKIPVEFFIDVMNRVIEVIGSSCLVLMDISPQLIDLLSQNIYYRLPSHLDINHEFNVPLPNQNPQRLTIGGILCLVHYTCKTILQILSHKGEVQKSQYVSTTTFLIEPSDGSPPKKDEKTSYMACIYPDYTGISSSYDKFSSIQRYATSEIYSLAAPWLSGMDKKQIIYVLEVVNTLLACHVFNAILQTTSPLQLQLLKRDLCSELQFYHEFVRKKLLDQHKYYIDGNLILRTKARDSKEPTENDYLLMLSHWFMIVCQLGP